MARLVILKGTDEGRQFELAEAVVSVGRDASNRIRLHDTEVSRRHAEFRQADGGFQVCDLASANGTFVNSQKVQKALLHPGDQITIGQTLLLFSNGGRDGSSPPGDLARKISVIARGGDELTPSIIKTIGEGEGSRLLTRPDRASPWLQSQLANLTVLYEASQAISHILDVPQLLTRLLELLFRSVPADRGCVLLTSEQGEPEPRAIYWRNGGEHPEQKILLSRTIIDYVLRERQGILLSDAARDERFREGQSIVRLGIREVIAVPMKGRHDSLGVLYLDTQLTPRELATTEHPAGSSAKFTEDHLALAIAVAHQAALAVEETRYHHALLQAERLAAIGQTIAALSHHIKNILQGLRSGNEIMKMGLDQKNDKLLHQGWRVAEKNQGKIYDLVMDMLSYSKDRVPAVEPTNVNDLVQEVHDLLLPRAQELGVKLETSLAPHVPTVSLDAEGIHRALLNLAGNALDAAEGRENAQVTVGTRLEDGWVRIVVLDNGVGIPPEKVREMFKPFVSTKGSRGTGLGLPVSQKIVREHGGELQVQSQVNVGSKFTIRLPLKSPFAPDLSATGVDIPIFPPEPD